MWVYLGQKYILKNWHESFFFNLLLLLLFFTFWPHCTACGLLTPWPGVEPGLLALEAPSINHWSAREAPTCIILNNTTVQNYYSIYFKFLVKNYLFYMTPSPSLVDFFLFKIFILPCQGPPSQALLAYLPGEPPEVSSGHPVQTWTLMLRGMTLNFWTSQSWISWTLPVPGATEERLPLGGVTVV